jgi:PAS domain S-box-containing protein
MVEALHFHALDHLAACEVLLDGRVQFRNRRWVEYTGVSQLGKAEELRKVVVHPEDLDRLERPRGASIASGEPYEEEMRIRRIDGGYRWFLVRAVPLRDKRGKVVKWYGAATDIEDHKRAEQLQADLAHVSRVSMMGELSASLAHEIKQPIAATVVSADACLQFLKHENPDLEDVREAASGIAAAAMRAADIIDRLRSLYTKSRPKRELVEVNEIIQEMVPLLRSEANEYAVSIRTDLVTDLPKITADRVQLQQVLMNLMLNGIEAMKETGGVLAVKTERSECGQVMISVSDTGVGLPAEKADEIFNALLHHQISRQRHGAGDQPFHRGSAWWPSVGHIPRRTRRDLSFRLAGGARGNKASRGCRTLKRAALGHASSIRRTV